MQPKNVKLVLIAIAVLILVGVAVVVFLYHSATMPHIYYYPVNGVNLPTNSIIATINVTGRISSALYVPSGNYVYVTDEDTNTTYILQGAEIIGNLSVGHPYSMLYDPSNKYIYAIGAEEYGGNETASVISGASEIGTINLGKSRALDALYDPKNGFVYAIGDGNIIAINGTRAIATLPGSLSAYVDNWTGYVYARNLNLFLINGTDVVGYINSVQPTGSMLYDPSNHFMYVGTFGGYMGSNNLVVFNGTVTNGTIQIWNITIPGSQGLLYYSPIGNYVYAVDYNSGYNAISIVNGTTNFENLTFASIGRSYFGFANGFVARDGSFYIYNQTGGATILRGNITVGTAKVGAYYGSAYDPRNGYVYYPVLTAINESGTRNYYRSTIVVARVKTLTNATSGLIIVNET